MIEPLHDRILVERLPEYAKCLNCGHETSHAMRTDGGPAQCDADIGLAVCACRKYKPIVIPDCAKEKAKKAKVLAVGPGKWGDDGYFYKTACKPGDIVLVPGVANKFPDWEQSDTILIQEGDVGAIIG